MRKKLLLGLEVLLVLAAAGLLAAQQDSPPAGGQEPPRRGMEGPPPVMGVVTKVGVNQFEIKKPDGSTQTIFVNEQTHLRQRQEGQQKPQEFQLEDLKPGDHVFVRGANDDKQAAMGVMRVTEEQVQRFQSGGGPGGGMGPGGGRGMMDPAHHAGGEILSIDGNQIKVRGRQGERTIVVNDKTTFNKEGQTIGLKDLKAGDHIFAMGSETNGQFVATEVHSGRPGGGRGGWQGGPQQGPPQN